MFAKRRKNMLFKQISSGGDRNFSYLIASEKTGEGALIDPSPDPEKVMAAVGGNIKIRYVINTHSHFDHTGGNDYFSRDYEGGPVTIIDGGEESGQKEGKLIDLGGLSLEIIPTPGHTADSICIKAGNKLITGDTLFVGKVGGTYGRQDAAAEFESLKKLIALDPETEVWPGHDYGIRPNSTIRDELKENPFIKRLDSFEDFLWLKENWARYKIEHGIK
jgi:glyoxylase-like metal-dependent hydrolase (beta-lactamase superfamily II)